MRWGFLPVVRRLWLLWVTVVIVVGLLPPGPVAGEGIEPADGSVVGFGDVSGGTLAPWINALTA